MVDSSEAWSLKKTVAPAIEGVKKNWLPFLLIQVAMALIVVGYYQIPGVRSAAIDLGRLKTQGGLLFGFLAGFGAGGVFPELAKLATGKLKKLDLPWLRESIFNGIVYGVIGVQVVVFYAYQNQWFGSGNDFRTLLTKTTVDMGIFSPIVSIPTATLLFEFRRQRYSLKSMARIVDKNYYRDKMLPGLIPCWCFWIPTLFSVYAMPPDLQFPLSILAEAAWSILFVFITKSGQDADDAQALPPATVP